MLAYIIRRLLLMIPTLFGIMLVNFAIVQVAPGGPVEQVIAQLRGGGGGALARIAGSSTGETGGASAQNRERPRPRPRDHQAARAPVRLRQAAGRALPR